MNKLESEMIQAINRGVKMKKDNTEVIPNIIGNVVIVENYGQTIARIYFDSREIEFVKAGLQECVEHGEGWATTHRVWKKECKDE